MPGLLVLFVFLLIGGLLQQQFSLPVPAAIVGMLLLLCFLLLRGKTPESLQQITQTLSPLLPLFLIPVSSGIVTQKSLVRDYGFELVVILALSLVPGILVMGWVMTAGKDRKNHDS